jgi:hypothetical protein
MQTTFAKGLAWLPGGPFPLPVMMLMRPHQRLLDHSGKRQPRDGSCAQHRRIPVAKGRLLEKSHAARELGFSEL